MSRYGEKTRMRREEKKQAEARQMKDREETTEMMV